MNNGRKNQKGFTLVEVVIASMLLVMVFLAVFPFLSTCFLIVKTEQTKMEAQLVGDRIFDRIASEFQDTRQVYPGMYEDVENVLEEDFNVWEVLDLECSNSGFEIEITAEAVEEHWLYLTVILEKEGDMVYQRNELIPLLNP